MRLLYRLLFVLILFISLAFCESFEHYFFETNGNPHHSPPILSPMEELACPTLDWVTWESETLCDGNNYVVVCYEVTDTDGDSIFVEFNAIWDDSSITMTTIEETVPGYSSPNFGWVLSGIHCFYWDIGTDMPNVEIPDFEIGLTIHNETTEFLTVSDSFDLNLAEGITFDGTNLWVSQSEFDADSTIIYCIDPVTHDTISHCVIDRRGYFADMCWHDGYIYIVGATGGSPTNRGRIFQVDPVTCTLMDSTITSIIDGSRWGQGIDYSGGYFWLTDTHGWLYRVNPVTLEADPPGVYTDLEAIYAGSHGGADLFPEGLADAIVFALGSMWILKNPDDAVNNILYEFDMSGNFVAEYTLPTGGAWGPEGVTYDGSCFWYTDHSNNRVYRVCLWGCDDGDTITNWVDTRAPEIELTCPTDSVEIGEEITFTWSFDDYAVHYPCSIYIDYCGGTFSDLVSSNSYDWIVPMGAVDCDSIFFEVNGRDMVCLWDADTCAVFPKTNFEVELVSPATDGYIACMGQQVIFEIHSSCELTFFTSTLTIDGTDVYNTMSPELALTYGADTLMTYTPSTPWTSGTHTVEFFIENICGQSFDSTFTFLFDYDPPVINSALPTGTLPRDSFHISIDVEDIHSGIGNVYVTVETDCGTFNYPYGSLIPMGDSLLTPNIFCEGLIEACVWVEDNPLYCSPNEDSLCWSFNVPPSGIVDGWITEPIDSNLDGNVYSACEDQIFTWYINHENTLDTMSMVIDICGVAMYLSDPEIYFANDTLYYFPSSPWLDGEECIFCLNYIEDVYGTSLAEPICDTVIFDMANPYTDFISPYPGDTIYGSSSTVNAEFIDNACSTVVIDSIYATSFTSGIRWRATEFPLELTGLFDDDSISVCTHIRDICADYCENHDTTICWTYFAVLGELDGEVVEPIDRNDDDRIISACTTQVIRILVYDDSGIDTTGHIHLYIDELSATPPAFGHFRNGDLLLSPTLSGDSLYVEFNPWLHGLDWTPFEGEIIHFMLDSIQDMHGFNIPDPIGGYFTPDFTPPVIHDVGPFGTMHDNTITIEANAFDTLCASATPIDSMVAIISSSGERQVVFGEEGDITGLRTGDTVFVCAYTHDQCYDYCGPNMSDTCWSFDIELGGISAVLDQPVDENHDGIVVSYCDNQHIVWLIDHTDPLVTSEISVSVEGDTFDYPDRIHLSGDTLRFIPDITWEHNDTIEFCIEHLEDVTGTELFTTACGYMIIDLEPPIIEIASGPMDGDTLFEDNTSGLFTVYDSTCGYLIPDSIIISITTASPPYDTIIYDSDIYTLDGLLDGDSVHVCAYAHEECADYNQYAGEPCRSGESELCFDYTVSMGSINIVVQTPRDFNDDGIVISTCPDQEIRWTILHAYDIIDTTIRITVDEIEYPYPSPELTLIGDTLIFNSPTEYTDGDSIHFCFGRIGDVTGSWLSLPVCRYVIIDLQPPELSIADGPMPYDIVNIPAIEGIITAIDNRCEDVLIDSIIVSTSVSMIDTVFYDSLYSVEGLVNGDSVTICVYASDDCEDITCVDTSGVLCYDVYIELGSMTATLIEPIDLNDDSMVVSSCEDQKIIWIVSHDQPLDSSSIVVTVESDEFIYPDHLELHAGSSFDTLIFTPDSPWDDSDTIEFCLDSLADITSAVLTSPICSEFIVDITPPRLATTTPPDGAEHHADSVTISATFIDNICSSSSIIVDTCWARNSTAGVVRSADLPIIMRGVRDGDSIRVCVVVHDECMDYCDFNTDTLCWEFTISMGEPWVVMTLPADRNGDGRRITNCDNQQVELLSHDSHGMDTTYFRYMIDGVSFNTADSIWLEDGGNDFYLRWVPSVAFDDGWVDVMYDTVYNTLGDLLHEPFIDSFFVDITPPFITFIAPSGEITASTATVSASALDNICGLTLSRDSLVITSSLSGIYENRGSSWSSYDITGLVDGDVVTICAYAHDLCADTCDYNYADTCVSFEVMLGEISATLHEPRDLNSDGAIISTCTDLTASWIVDHTYPIDETSLEILACLDTFDMSTGTITLSGDTIFFTPIMPWTPSDTCEYCLINICDTLENCIDTSICVEIIFDTLPPVLSDIDPPITDVLTSDTYDVNATVLDNLCGLSDFADSIIAEITVDGSVVSTITSDEFPLVLADLEEGQEIDICAYLADNCADYCEYNDTVYCWHYITSGGPSANWLSPRDINGDGTIITACENQQIRFLATDRYGLQNTNIVVTVDGHSYSEEDLDVRYGADSTQLYITWIPSTALENETWVRASLDTVYNNFLVNISASVVDSFLVDVEAPVLNYTGPEDFWMEDSFSASVSAIDNICSSVEFDSIVVSSTISGTHLNLGSPSDFSIGGLENGDIVSICCFAYDGCIDTCGPNYLDTCITFDIMLGSVLAEIIPPHPTLEYPISACEDQQLRWLITHEHDIDLNSVAISIESVIFTFDDNPTTGDSILWFSGDTLIFMPNITDFYTNGVFTHYSLDSICDIIDNCLAFAAYDSILFDFEPPNFANNMPTGTIVDVRPEISIEISDEISGVDVDNLVMIINSDTVSANWNGTSLTYTPTTDLLCSNPYNVEVYALDTPDICDGNSAYYDWTFNIVCPVNVEAHSGSIEPGDDITEGTDVVFKALFENTEDNTIRDIEIAIYLDGDFVDYYVIDSIVSGEYDSLLHLFDNLASGTYELCFIADYENAIDETNEDDNTVCLELTVTGVECDAHPNPFTPNGDGIYEQAIFEYPGQGELASDAEILIYDLDDRLVTTLDGSSRTWDGKDDDGEPMPKGVYVYLVKNGSDTICHGTIYLAR